MTKTPIKKQAEKPETKLYNPKTDYKSFEQKVLVDSGVLEFGKDFVKGFYGAVSSMFTIPKLIRKLANEQTLLDRERDYLNKNSFANSGDTSGMATGLVADFSYIGYSIFEAAKNQNYLPLGILGATNALSLAYELGRLKQSKKEHLDMRKARFGEPEQITDSNYDTKEHAMKEAEERVDAIARS